MIPAKKESKKQISIYIDGKLIKDFDRWIKKKGKGGYLTDRSHVITVLLTKFLEKNL